MRKLKYVILLVVGIFIGSAIEKIVCFRAEFSTEVWTVREKLSITVNLMRKLVDDCEKHEYKILSATHEVDIKYFGKKVKDITRFPHYGLKEIQEMFEEKHQRFIEIHKAMNEQIEQCEGT